MHGFVNRSIQLFVTNTFGHQAWVDVTADAGLDFVDFEGMMQYDHVCTPNLLDSCAKVLNRSRPEIMEDIGTFIVSDANFQSVRRLLRFGGIDFVDFLHSLDDLDERVKLAINDLVLPKVELHPEDDGNYRLHCQPDVDGYGHVMMGVLRAMADDYGALAMLDHVGTEDGTEIISIQLIETEFSEGKRFELGESAA